MPSQRIEDCLLRAGAFGGSRATLGADRELKGGNMMNEFEKSKTSTD